MWSLAQKGMVILTSAIFKAMHEKQFLKLRVSEKYVLPYLLLLDDHPLCLVRQIADSNGLLFVVILLFKKPVKPF
jgi:hypothetical protein